MLPLSARAKSVTRRCCLTSQGAPFTVPHETINGASFWKFEGSQLQELLDRVPERAALWALNDADRPGWRPAAAAGPRRVLVRVAASSGGGGEKCARVRGAALGHGEMQHSRPRHSDGEFFRCLQLSWQLSWCVLELFVLGSLLLVLLALMKEIRFFSLPGLPQRLFLASKSFETRGMLVQGAFLCRSCALGPGMGLVSVRGEVVP